MIYDAMREDCQSISPQDFFGKKAQVTEVFMIIARIESLILEPGVDDALNRAEA